MHIFSIIPTVVLAFLTSSGVSQKVSPEALFPAEVNDAIEGVKAISFSLKSLVREFNLIGSKSVVNTLSPLFNATDTLTAEVLNQFGQVLAIPSQEAQNAVIAVESDLVGDYQTLYISIANHGGYDIVTKIFLRDTWATLKTNALKLTDIIARLLPRQETAQLNNREASIFGQAENAFKVGKVRG